MEEKKLTFDKVVSDNKLQEVIDSNADAFNDTELFPWKLSALKKIIKNGWELYAVSFEKDVVAALLIKKHQNTLLTKNTSIKLSFQGNGFSHQIKDFYEDKALEYQLNRLVNYCPADNFRMLALNEGHDYQIIARDEKNNIVEWEKTL